MEGTMETRGLSSEETRADLVITNAKVITVDKDFTIRQAVAVKDGKITAVGTDDEVKPFIGGNTRVLDLKGKSVLPGINECHMHAPFFGATRPPLSLDLTYPAIKSIPDMVAALEKKVAETPAGEWIRGFGWDQSSLEECKNDPSKLPRKGDLDAVSPDHPVAFTDFSCHTLLVNSKALALAGVTKDTPDPPSGEMERDANGAPTGILKEPGAQALVSIHVPLLSREEKKTALLTALSHLNANGVTSFTDAAIGPGGETFLYGVMSADFVDLYRELLEEGKLTARVTALLLLGDYGALTYEDLENGLKTFKVPTNTDRAWLQFPGVKIFADGIPLTYTSWMNADYVSGDAGHGRSVIPGETDQEQRDSLVDMIKLVHHYDYQIGLHATGDQAIDAAVDGFVQAVKEKRGGDPRHYIIHGDFISAEKARILAEHNCGIAMQPFISVMIADFQPAVVGETLAAYEWPTRTVLDAGLNLTSSSDAPVTYPNWRMGVQAAVLREGLVSGKVSGPEECITVEEAIRTYTINGAWQDHMEDKKGSIEVGKFADFCVIGEDILTANPHKIGEIPVLMTIVDGKIVFDEIG
jgi:predicted amidohydrolase YtcJ